MISAAPRPSATVARRAGRRAVVHAMSLLALSAAVLMLLWLTQRLARTPQGARIVRAEMAQAAPARTARAAAVDDPVTWRPLDMYVLATWRGPYRLRYRVAFSSRDTAVPYAVGVSLRAAFTATWDGVPLGANGAPGRSTAEEVPGRVDWLAPVPATRAGVGEHELLLYASSHHLRAPLGAAEAGVRVAPLAPLAVHAHRAWLLPVAAVGALLTAVVYVLLVLARAGALHEARDLLGMALSGTLLAAAEAWRPLVGYAYPWHVTRLRVVLLLTALTMFWLARYVRHRLGAGQGALHHAWPLRLVWGMPVTFAVIAFGVPSYDFAAWLMHLTGVGGALLLFVITRTDARDLHAVATLLLTALVAMIVAPQEWLDGSYLIVLAAVLVTVLLGHASHLRDRALHAQGLESTRLRLTAALVHRSIQPHWLMNTLTGMQELIEQDPPRASRLVELLADEFRLLSNASRDPWIPGEQELTLCRTHLAIVSQALPTPRRLLVEGEPLLHDVALPPGVLHTLLENALTHGGVVAPEATPDLLLRCRVERACLTIEFDAPRGRGADRSRTIANGTGTQFVESSLEAAFPGAWRFGQAGAGDRWQATLSVPLAAARAARASLGGSTA